MRVRWTVPAADDLQSIKNYLQENHPQFAEPTVRKFISAFYHSKSHRIWEGLEAAPAPGNLQLRHFLMSGFIR
jgi:hypothetical protein